MNINYFLGRIKKFIWSEDIVFLLKRPAYKEVPQYDKKLDGVLKRVTLDNVNDCCEFEGEDNIPRYIDFIKKDYCILYGYNNGKCVYRNIAMFPSYLEHEGVVIRKLGKKEGVIGYNYCAEESRGKGFGRWSMIELFKIYNDYDFYAVILPDNYPAMWNALSVGYEIKSILKFRFRLFTKKLEEKELTEEEINNYLLKFYK